MSVYIHTHTSSMSYEHTTEAEKKCDESKSYGFGGVQGMTLFEAREILDDETLSDEEVIAIIENLYQVANVIVEQYVDKRVLEEKNKEE